MSYHLFPVPFIVVGTLITWFARNKEQYRTVAIFQPLTTVLTVAVAGLSLLAPSAEAGFTYWMLAGLILSLIGDVFNINMTRDEILYPALIVFTAAYFVYPIGLTVYNGFQPPDAAVAALLVFVGVAVVACLWNHLDHSWRIPVVIYTFIMLFMVSRAVSTFFGSTFSLLQCILLTVGTSILFVADFEYSIHRFRRPFRFIVGPLLYPTGQLLIALSPSYFPVT